MMMMMMMMMMIIIIYFFSNYLRGKSNLEAVVKDFILSYFENSLLYFIFPKYLMKYCKLWSPKPPSAL